MVLAHQATVTVFGCDGSQWIIHGPGSKKSPVRMLEGAIGDLIDPPVATTYKARVGQAGSQYRGHKVEARNVVLHLGIFGNSGIDWARTDSDFRKAFRYDKDTTISVYTPMSGERTLKVRLEESPEFEEELDPHELQLARYTFTLIAGDPYWYSDTYTDEFTFGGDNWYGGGVIVDNPTDVDIWPKWVLQGQMKAILPDWNEDRKIVIPFMTEGTAAVIDTDPMEELITTTNNTLSWANMNGQFFMNPIPPYTSDTFVPVTIDPLPKLDLVLPRGWREYFSQKIQEWADSVGPAAVASATASDVAAVIRAAVVGATPSWLQPLGGTLVGALTLSYISARIAESWVNPSTIIGNSVQVRLVRRWSRPWGLE